MWLIWETDVTAKHQTVQQYKFTVYSPPTQLSAECLCIHTTNELPLSLATVSWRSRLSFIQAAFGECYCWPPAGLEGQPISSKRTGQSTVSIPISIRACWEATNPAESQSLTLQGQQRWRRERGKAEGWIKSVAGIVLGVKWQHRNFNITSHTKQWWISRLQSINSQLKNEDQKNLAIFNRAEAP